MSNELTRLCNKAKRTWRILLALDLVALAISIIILVYFFVIEESLLIPIILTVGLVLKLGLTILNNPDLI